MSKKKKNIIAMILALIVTSIILIKIPSHHIKFIFVPIYRVMPVNHPKIKNQIYQPPHATDIPGIPKIPLLYSQICLHTTDKSLN